MRSLIRSLIDDLEEVVVRREGGVADTFLERDLSRSNESNETHLQALIHPVQSNAALQLDLRLILTHSNQTLSQIHR